MRQTPSDDYDKANLAELKPAPWMIPLLDLNPDYVWWGPYEDYMTDDKSQWASRRHFNSWNEFGPWKLDDLNECVNFYFQLDRASAECETCGGSGTHPDSQWVSESFYRHSSPFVPKTGYQKAQEEALAEKLGLQQYGIELSGNPPTDIYKEPFASFCHEMTNGDGYWADKITPDEAAALRSHHREHEFKGQNLTDEALADAYNHRQRTKAVGHDAINRSILIETRLARLGMPQYCEACEGRGSIWTADQGHVNLILWILHPRKGCSRGVEVKHILEPELPAIFAWLRNAANRNTARFAKIPEVIS